MMIIGASSRLTRNRTGQENDYFDSRRFTHGENGQNLVIEGAYIPFNWKEDFDKEYLKEIKYYCLVMPETYINNHFNQIKKYANIVEKRPDDSWCTKESVLEENVHNFEMCKRYGCNYILIDKAYCIDIEL